MSRLGRVALAGIAVLVAACADGTPRPIAATRMDSAGVELVASVGEDVVYPLSLNRVLQLGGEASGPESFYQIDPSGVSVGEAGRVAVLDRQSSQVSVFESDGRHVLTVGREGDGPGEFRYPSSVALMPDGEIVMFDYGKRALVRFASDGSLLDQLSFGVPYNGRGMVPNGGGLMVLSQNAPRGDGELIRRLLHLTATDTVQVGPIVSSSSGNVFYESCGVRMTQPPLFAADLVWATNGRRTVMAPGPEYSILVFEGTELVAVYRRDVAPESATEAVVTRMLGEGERWDIGGRECTVPIAELIEERGMGATVPIIHGLALSPTGEIWVDRVVPGSEERVVDLLAPDGEYRGTVGADLPFPVRFLPDGRFFAIEADSLDLERLVLYEVHPGDSG